MTRNVTDQEKTTCTDCGVCCEIGVFGMAPWGLDECPEDLLEHHEKDVAEAVRLIRKNGTRRPPEKACPHWEPGKDRDDTDIGGGECGIWDRRPITCRRWERNGSDCMQITKQWVQVNMP